MCVTVCVRVCVCQRRALGGGVVHARGGQLHELSQWHADPGVHEGVCACARACACMR